MAQSTSSVKVTSIYSAEEGGRRLASRAPREDLAPHPALPADTRLWAALVQASGGVWGGCVYDADAIVEQLARGAIKMDQHPFQSQLITTERVIL